MKQYHEALEYILDNGVEKIDRTGVGTLSTFGYQMRFDLRTGFPAITTKKLAWRSVVSELLWFLEGSSDERRLAEILYSEHRENIPEKTTIWTANANADYWKPKAQFDGDLGRVYGRQWRDFGGVDQIQQLINNIKTNPQSRRHIISAWNPPELDQMALPPCHVMSQFDVTNGYLSCQLYQRSVDAPLGLPFNIASYSLLTHMLAQLLGLKVGEFIHTSGDLHIYKNQVDGIKEQLKRDHFPSPTLEMPKFSTLDELINTAPDQYKLINYQHHPVIKMPFAV